MPEENIERIAVFYREMILFFAVLFFTCVVGIIGLLPQLEEINGLLSWNWLLMSFVYFGLLFGIDYSVKKFFWLYRENRRLREAFNIMGIGFFYPDVDFFVQRIFKKLENLERFLIIVITLVFFLLYLVKIGILH